MARLITAAEREAILQGYKALGIDDLRRQVLSMEGRSDESRIEKVHRLLASGELLRRNRALAHKTAEGKPSSKPLPADLAPIIREARGWATRKLRREADKLSASSRAPHQDRRFKAIEFVLAERMGPWRAV